MLAATSAATGFLLKNLLLEMAPCGVVLLLSCYCGGSLLCPRAPVWCGIINPIEWYGCFQYPERQKSLQAASRKQQVVRDQQAEPT